MILLTCMVAYIKGSCSWKKANFHCLTHWHLEDSYSSGKKCIDFTNGKYSQNVQSGIYIIIIRILKICHSLLWHAAHGFRGVSQGTFCYMGAISIIGISPKVQLGSGANGFSKVCSAGKHANSQFSTGFQVIQHWFPVARFSINQQRLFLTYIITSKVATLSSSPDDWFNSFALHSSLSRSEGPYPTFPAHSLPTRVPRITILLSLFCN